MITPWRRCRRGGRSSGGTITASCADHGNASAGLFVPGVSSHVENASLPSRVWHVFGPNAVDVSRGRRRPWSAAYTAQSQRRFHNTTGESAIRAWVV